MYHNYLILMAKKTNKQQRNPATFNLRMIKNRQETDGCPTRKYCVELWGGEDVFCEIRNLTKFELIHQKDEFIYKIDDPVTSLYIIQSGAIKLEKEVGGGGNHVSGFYFTGDLIGSESLGLEQHHYNAIALKETWVCEIRLQKLTALGISSATILQKVNAVLSRNLRELDEHLYNSRYLNTEQRLLGLFNGLCEKDLDPVDDNLNHLLVPMTKTDIANYLGMRRESLSRALRQLESAGIVKSYANTRIIVIDKQKLLNRLGKAIMFGNCLKSKW